MQTELSKPFKRGISIWVSPAEETKYEPARLLTYDKKMIAIRSLIGYAVGQKILIGRSTSPNRNDRHGIEALLKAGIFWGRKIEAGKNSYFEYQAEYLPIAESR
jgi:hypothetical protein